MFGNVKRFRRITGTPLSILDNYSVRSTSEGQITSVWGKKKPHCVKNRKWCLAQTFASGFPQSQGLYLLRGCFEGPGDGALGSWVWTWPDPGLGLHLGLDVEKRATPAQTFIQMTDFCSSCSPSVNQVWLLLSTDYYPSGCFYMFYTDFCTSLPPYHAPQCLRGTQHFQHSVWPKASWIITQYMSETR